MGGQHGRRRWQWQLEFTMQHVKVVFLPMLAAAAGRAGAGVSALWEEPWCCGNSILSEYDLWRECDVGRHGVMFWPVIPLLIMLIPSVANWILSTHMGQLHRAR